jgi:hypothetical protein
MKYLITESQIDKVIFKYLDNQDFIHIKYGVNDYLVNSEKDEYAQIRYNRISDYCTINFDLVVEIVKFFSLSPSDAISVIDRWVEKTFNVSSVIADVQRDIIVYYF